MPTAVLFIALLFISSPAVAHHPDPWDPGSRPLVEVGASLEPMEMELLLNVGFRGFDLDGSPFDILHEPVIYIARVRATGSYGFGHHSHEHGHDHGGHSPEHDSAGSHFGSHLEIDFTPIGVEGYAGDFFISAGAAETQLTRDLHVNENLGVLVTALGVRAGTVIPESENLDLILALSASALGAKINRYAEGREFNGLHIASAGAEIAQRLRLGGFSVSLAAGAETGFATTLEADPSLAYSWNAYGELRFDIGRYVRLFSRLSWHGIGDTGLDEAWSNTEILAGIQLRFF